MPENHRQFNYEPLKFMLGSEVPIDPEAELLVFRDLRFMGGCVCTNYGQMAFEEFTLHDLTVSAPAVSRSSSSSTYIPTDVRTAMLAKYPFLTDEDFKKSLRPDFASRSSGRSSSRPNLGPLGQRDFIAAYHGALGAPPDVPELENEVAVGPLEPMDGDDVDSELARLREDVAEEAHAEMYFYARVRGGRWTAANRGVVADAIYGYARGGIARAFCDNYNFPKKMRTKIMKHSVIP